MLSRPSHTIRKYKRSWLSAAVAGGVLLLAVMAWRSLRMPEPRPRREPPEKPSPEHFEENSSLPFD